MAGNPTGADEEEAGLIHASLRGRERIYQVDTTRLATLTTAFIQRFSPSHHLSKP